MRMTGHLTRTAVVLTALGGALTVTAPAANAAPAAIGDTAPACISRPVYSTPNGFDVFLTNKCGGTRAVKVIVDSGGDSPCYVMGNNTSVTFSYEGIFGNYGKTVMCA
ncbi:beta-Ig-H3/fasciclin [Streptomyces sp. NPDC005474]|uniref:beta-Ig-H3/fasciclin n=1 Tax=Streptomyces sp. NPDC005474 TaxID=3154878 RepID=UPI0034563DD2